MKKILIISPHFPPSNLVGVHRARFISSHLKDFDWEPIVLTVHEKYYEESLDWNLHKLLPEDLRIEKVKAASVTKPRLIGDIGLRGFRHLYKKAKHLILREQVDFLYITIPSFYCALLGRLLHKSTGIEYGIDYQDPWVHKFRGSGRLFSRHWFAQRVSKILEPYAVKHATLITGVSTGYYESVARRNPHLKTQATFGSLAIGTEPSDYQKVRDLGLAPYLFTGEPGKIKLVYAGTMLPKAYAPFEVFCDFLQKRKAEFAHVEIHFIGSGSRANDPESYNVKSLAQKYGLWQTQVFEYPARIPYLDVLIHLNEADGIFLLGSTETHYSPSKVYQSILSGKPIFAILHQKSTAIDVIKETQSGEVLDFNGESDLDTIRKKLPNLFSEFVKNIKSFRPKEEFYKSLEPFFAKNIAAQLASLLDKVVTSKKDKRRMLIISPHFPPSNLTAVHRARLFSQYLPHLGYDPIVLTVDEKYYEEELDHNLSKLVSEDTQISKVRAAPVFRPRVIGDIGLRAFISTYRRAKKIIKEEKIDFLYIIIPSFYGALWGRLLHERTGVLYGIDYIDPWVHLFPGGEKIFSRAWMATKLSGMLEPFAVRKASLISGVAESYYEDVFLRNPKLAEHCKAITLPPAAEGRDFEKLDELPLKPLLFKPNRDKIQLIYAGAMLPKAYGPLESIMQSIAENRLAFADVEFHFIGSGRTPTDHAGFNIKPMAEKYKLWQKQIFEYPARIGYLEVLLHLKSATGVFILGSTEAHYTPSKVYQAVLSQRPIFSILHNSSTGVNVIRESRAGVVLGFGGPKDLSTIKDTFLRTFEAFRGFVSSYDYAKTDHSQLKNYSPEVITRQLVEEIENIINPS